MKGYRVVHIGPSLGTHGGISSVLRIYHAQLRDKFDFLFIPSYLGKGRLWDILLFGYSLLVVFFLCLVDKNIIFHIHTSTGGSFFRKSIIAGICFSFRRKVIFHIHGSKFEVFVEKSSPRKKQQIIKVLNKADRVVVLSQSWYEYLSQYVSGNKLKVIYNPCSSIADSFKERSDCPAKLVFTGRLSALKGIYDLIEAVKVTQSSSFKLHIYGDGNVKRVKGLVEKYGLETQVILHDWVSPDSIIKILDTSHILVLPSYYEGLPMAVLEAMGRGLPVIATDVGGIPEAVIDRENGFIIKPGDIKMLADRISTLADDPGLREKMGRRSLEIVRQKFSVNKIGQQLEDLYREVFCR